MDKIFGADGVYTKFKIHRNRKICEIEAVFFLLNALLFIFSWIILGLGFRLTGSKIMATFNSSEYDKVHDGTVVINTLMFIGMFFTSLCGIKFAIDRNSPKISQVCYFIILFFFLMIPLLSEGSILLEMSGFDAEKIEDTCSMHRDEIRAKVK